MFGFDSVFRTDVPVLELVVRTVLVYAAFLVAMRVFGKREVGQLTLPDLVLVLLAANALQPAMTGPDSSVTGAVVIIVTMFVLNYLVTQARARSSRIERLITPPPTLLAEDGAWIRRNLRKEGVSIDEAEEAVRQASLPDVSHAARVLLESDGRISVIPRTAASAIAG